MRWLTPFCSIATLLSLPISLIFSLFLFYALRSVDYEDTSSSLTAWPLLHVLMRSAYLHCIINKSEKWLFLPLSLLYFSPYNGCYLEEWLENRKSVLVDFLFAFPRSLLALTVQDHHTPIPLLHYLQGTKLFSLHNDIQFLLWHYLL